MPNIDHSTLWMFVPLASGSVASPNLNRHRICITQYIVTIPMQRIKSRTPPCPCCKCSGNSYKHTFLHTYKVAAPHQGQVICTTILTQQNIRGRITQSFAELHSIPQKGFGFGV